MLKSLLPDRRALVGALIGAGAALGGAFLAGVQARELPYTVLLVLAIALTGLVLGGRAAAWSWFAGVVVLTVVLVTSDPGPALVAVDTVRLAAFIIGSPLVVLLVFRSELARRTATEALAASREAQDQAAAERRRLEEARH